MTKFNEFLQTLVPFCDLKIRPNVCLRPAYTVHSFVMCAELMENVISNLIIRPICVRVLELGFQQLGRMNVVARWSSP